MLVRCYSRYLYHLSTLFIGILISFQARSEERTPSSTTEAVPQAERAVDENIQFDLVYKADFVRVVAGDQVGQGAYLGNLDLTFMMNLEKMFGARGLSFVIYGLGNHGDKPSSYIGDSFVTSNIEAPSTFKIYELYLKQQFNDEFGVLIGWRDLNADFYWTDSSAALLNSSFGISPSLAQTGINGPSIFPTTALALTARYEGNGTYLQAGLFNAVAGHPKETAGTHLNSDFKDGVLWIFETGFLSGKAPINSKYAIGFWGYSQEVDALDPLAERIRNQGGYVLVDHGLSEDVSVFLRHGWAPGGANQFSSATEMGAQWKGPWRSCAEDQISFGWARGQASREQRFLNNSTDSESVIELSYTRQVNSHLSLTPDFQWIFNPGLDAEASPAQVLGLRLKLQY